MYFVNKNGYAVYCNYLHPENIDSSVSIYNSKEDLQKDRSVVVNVSNIPKLLINKSNDTTYSFGLNEDDINKKNINIDFLEVIEDWIERQSETIQVR
jgi:uncharacterized protein YfeS